MYACYAGDAGVGAAYDALHGVERRGGGPDVAWSVWAEVGARGCAESEERADGSGRPGQGEEEIPARVSTSPTLPLPPPRLPHVSIFILSRFPDRLTPRRTDWLPSPVTPSTYSLPDGLIRRSLLQNDILFSSEGLTLYSLDRLYTFKSALSSYSRTRLPSRLEDAVDELRRLYLSSGGRKVKRADVLRSYDWLGVSEVALGEVDRMYRRAYGGVEGVGVIEGMRYEDRLSEIEYAIDDVIDLKMEEAGLSMLLFPNSPVETLTPICKAAPLRLQTTFDPPRKATAPRDNNGEAEEEEEEELTARPEREPGPWSASIDEVLDPPKAEKYRRPGSARSERVGPATPRAYEDISPVTRGEWGFLFSGAGFGVRTAAVETC